MNDRITARLGLILVAIIWGITFVLVKIALNDIPPFYFCSLRFGLATILSIIILHQKIFTCTRNECIGGVICGLFLFFGYTFQNFGLMNTTASKSAFITSVSVLLVPILIIMFKLQTINKKKFKKISLNMYYQISQIT